MRYSFSKLPTHPNKTNHSIDWDGSTVLERLSNSQQRKVLEAFYTHNNYDAINRAAIVPTACIPLLNNIHDKWISKGRVKFITCTDNYRISIRYILFYFICKNVFSIFISILDTLVLVICDFFVDFRWYHFVASFEKVWLGTLRKLRNKTIIILVETKLIILLNMEPMST